ncbi:MAG: hypothetical protein HC906_09930 [Bacteroidales bacterium]|nr:hypothetical protein [Bacteroidales bacterium]
MKIKFLLILISIVVLRVAGQNNYSDANVQTYTYPRISPKNNNFKVSAGEKDVFVYQSSAGPFAAFSVTGSTHIIIDLPFESGNWSISPKKHNITPVVEGKKLSFDVPGPILLVLENGGMPELYLYVNPLQSLIEKNENVKYFKGGQVYEVGEMILKDNETLYIEGGAIVRGCIRATSASNVRIAGYGVFDGSYYTKGVDAKRSIVFEDCRNSSINDIIMIEPSSWISCLAFAIMLK